MRTTKTITLWLVMCLALILSIGVQGQDVNVPDVNVPVIPDSNLIAPGDGILAGAMLVESASRPYIKLAYQYGVAQFFGIVDPDFKYSEFGTKWESRDIAQQGSVPGLSTLVLLIAPEKSEVTGTAGLSWSHDRLNRNDAGNYEDYFNTIVGTNIRPNQDKNFLIEVEGVTPIDKDIHFRVGFVWKF